MVLVIVMRSKEIHHDATCITIMIMMSKNMAGDLSVMFLISSFVLLTYLTGLGFSVLLF